MSTTYIERIPPVDEMPEWAQEAFHSSNFFQACLNKVTNMERQIRNLQREVDDLYASQETQFSVTGEPTAKQIERGHAAMAKHMNKYGPVATLSCAEAVIRAATGEGGS